MLAPFDVFRAGPKGQVLWLGAAQTFEEAEDKVRAAMDEIRAEYLIVDMRTGRQLKIGPGYSITDRSGVLRVGRY